MWWLIFPFRLEIRAEGQVEPSGRSECCSNPQATWAGELSSARDTSKKSGQPDVYRRVQPFTCGIVAESRPCRQSVGSTKCCRPPTG